MLGGAEQYDKQQRAETAQEVQEHTNNSIVMEHCGIYEVWEIKRHKYQASQIHQINPQVCHLLHFFLPGHF